MYPLTYKITIQSDGLAQVEFRGVGRDDRRESPLDLDQLPHLQPHLDDITRQTTQTRAKLTAFGRYLYNLLLTGSLRAHFEEVVWPLVNAPGSGVPQPQLVFSLTFQESDSLQLRQVASLPWEFIYFSHQGGVFLATDPRIAFMRRDRAYPDGADTLHDVSTLRVLLARLQPADAAPVSLARLRNVLGELEQAHAVKRPILPAIIQDPTPTRLAEGLAQIQPHVLHLLLHGRFAPDSTRFGFIDGQGQTRWYGDRSLTDLFAQHQPQLVVVQACEGGRLSDARSLAHGAARLLAAGVPAVVAMQYPITNQVGWEFSEILYRRLAAGDGVDTAVQAGRRHLARFDTSLPDDHASRDFGAVVLWQRPFAIRSIQEKAYMTQTIILITPEAQEFEAEVMPNTLVGEIVRAFVAHLAPASGQSTRYFLRLPGNDQPLDVTLTLAEAGVSDGARLDLVAEPLSPDDPVGLTIEDSEGERFATAVQLNTRLSQLLDAFLAQRPLPPGQQPAVTLVTNLFAQTSERPLPLQTTLYEAGVNHDALLRVTSTSIQREGITQ